ncbi:MAG: hypothetical protein IT467_11270 [Dokdonella sp.]|uniref:hypothetical protein n=1 Tax=Dokdonella sp. TaxID=2291710 RepID=UPI0025BB6C45|nr:hypothetical protein [Dokdonella sp.]MBZ0222807.1 hypothetical protein [Dokdonella sp.]MCC7256496.1 hypothetical protein [Dokdonella sp.]
MNTRLINIAACLLLAAITNLPIAKADPQGEADFLALRGKVRERAAGEPSEVKQRIKNAELTLTACLPGTPEPQDSRVSIALDDVDYFYGAPCTSTDCTYQCLYMVEPLHRALTLEEARDFSAALMMPDIPHAGYGKTGRARKAAIAAQGERHFAELRAVVRAGKAPHIDPASLGTAFRPASPNLVDCSAIPYAKLSDSLLPQAGNNRTLYNDTYYFVDLDATGPQRCIYMESPFQRGLTVDEARDLLSALQLDLGFSEAFRRQAFGDGPVPEDFWLPGAHPTVKKKVK